MPPKGPEKAKKPGFQAYFPARLAWTFAKMDVDRIHQRLLALLGTREAKIEMHKYLCIVVERSQRAADVDRDRYQGRSIR